MAMQEIIKVIKGGNVLPCSRHITVIITQSYDFKCGEHKNHRFFFQIKNPNKENVMREANQNVAVFYREPSHSPAKTANTVTQ